MLTSLVLAAVLTLPADSILLRVLTINDFQLVEVRHVSAVRAG